MVLLCGIPTDGPMENIVDTLEEASIPYLLLNQLDYTPLYITYQLRKGKCEGEIAIGPRSCTLEEITGVYNRVADVQVLREHGKLPNKEERSHQVVRAHETLMSWISITTARVLNQHRAMASNTAKPYQMMLIEKYGFKTPPSIITNDPAEVEAYRHQWGRLIYKSASGVRSIVQEFTPGVAAQLKQIRSCPTLFQQLLEGTNIRVHVVGEQVFATEIDTNRLDYRYAHKQGGQTHLAAIQLPPKIEAQCLALSKWLQLPLVGIDLLRTHDDQWYCFEANPSPGFSYYENHTGQPIAAAVAHYLAGY
ncbi:hypothetical protein [Paraflavitalea sp. CAU 1676]|uniref:ATP-grasp domain-containing protein n=1 Tax=Paraflavitalea sp. CAU 1676 TaxID=3032598 RepID=UPI0023D9CDE0|nr:hypothetical protein [Paraflavitalea sp. CAU 1676]MDF2192096.1 hypothetical protein [Paraflavitalea sp. CAU 1676]